MAESQNCVVYCFKTSKKKTQTLLKSEKEKNDII